MNTQNTAPKNDFRPRSDFNDEGEYLKQFMWLARPKLTKRLFFELSDGFYVVGNGFDFQLMMGPASERAAQWESIYPGARQRLCMIFRNKAHYEAMMEQGRKAGEENRSNENGIKGSKKTASQSGGRSQTASLTVLDVMRFSMQPVPESTQAIKMVFKLLKGVPESEFTQEVPRLAVETIKAFKVSGKIEFLTGMTTNGEFVLCAGFEPFAGFPDTARLFNARLSSRIPIEAHSGAKVKLNKTQCSTEELKVLRSEYIDQGRFIFSGGKMIGHSAPAESWIAKALGIVKNPDADVEIPEDGSDERNEAVDNYADNCAGVES